MKVYLLLYSDLFNNDEDIYGIYSTYEKAKSAIPPHEVTTYYDIFETTLDNVFLWDKPDEQ